MRNDYVPNNFFNELEIEVRLKISQHVFENVETKKNYFKFLKI